MARSLPTGSPLLLAPPRKAFSFTDYSRLAPMQSLPGDRLDTELESIRASLSAVVEVLRGVVSGEIPIAEVDLTNVVAFAAPAQFGDGPNGIPINPADQIGTRTLTQRTGSVSGYPQQDVLLTQPVYDMTPAAQDALNSANAARDAAIIARNQAASSQTAAASSAGAASVSAGAASSSEANALASKNAASTSASGAAGSATTAGNYSNTGQLTLNKTYTAEHYAWNFAEYLSGPVMTEAEYAALDPALIPPGYTYNPVAGMPAGLWSAKWWAIKAQQVVLGAGTSADDAAQSAADAAADSAATAAALDEFTDLYLGSGPANPSLDHDGNALKLGAQFFNTTLNQMMVFGSSGWQTLASSGSSATTASAVTFVPAGGIAAVNVQLAIQELDAEKPPLEPQDGGTYGRKSGAWVSVVSPSIDWSAITGKPSTFPPSAHSHPISQVTGLQAALDGKVDDAEMTSEIATRSGADSTLTTNLATETTNRQAADTTLQTNINAKIGDAPSDGKAYQRKDAAWIAAPPTGANPNAAPPSSPQAGQFWWESDTGSLFVYFDDGNTSQWVQVNYTPPAPDLSGYLQKTGGTMSGQLLLPTPGTGPAAAPKSYVDAGDAAVAAGVPAQIVTAQQAVPSVLSHRAGSGTVALAANTIVKIPMVIMVGPVGAWAINGTGGLICPKRGVYLISGSCSIVTTAATNTMDVGFQINAGSVFAGVSRFMQQVASAFQWSVPFSRLQFLDVGDVVYLAARTSVACTAGDAIEYTALSAALVTAVP